MAEIVRTKVAQGGRIIIPVEIRKRLGIEIGENENLEVEDDSLRITTSQTSLRRLQKNLRKLVPKGVPLVDELIAEWRQEAKND